MVWVNLDQMALKYCYHNNYPHKRLKINQIDLNKKSIEELKHDGLAKITPMCIRRLHDVLLKSTLVYWQSTKNKQLSKCSPGEYFFWYFYLFHLVFINALIPNKTISQKKIISEIEFWPIFAWKLCTRDYTTITVTWWS